MTTKEQAITAVMQKQGYTLAGTISGQHTTRRGSNLHSWLVNHDLLDTYLTDQKAHNDGLISYYDRHVLVIAGAHKQHRTEGTNLHIYTK